MKILLFAPGCDDRRPLIGSSSPLGASIAELAAQPDVELVGVAGAIEGLSGELLGVGLFDLDEGSSRGRPARALRRAVIRDAASGVTGGISWQDPAWNTIAAIADADAVLILGTGSAHDVDPDRADQFAAVAEIAGVFSTPIAFSGLRLSGGLVGGDQALVESALRSAAIVGVADRQSFDWAVRIGVPESRLGMNPVGLSKGTSSPSASAHPDSGGYVVADFRGLDDADLFRGLLTRLVTRVAEVTGLRTVVLSEGLAAGALALSDIAPRADADDPMPALVAGAALVVSTELDVVLAAARAGVASVAVGSRPFSASTLGGALERIGMAEWVLLPGSLASADLAIVIEDGWTRRAEIAEHLAQAVLADTSLSQRWWRDVVAALAGRPVQLDGVADPASLALTDRDLAARTAFAHTLARRRETHHARQADGWQTRVDELEQRVDSVERVERQVGELHAELLDARALLADSDRELAAAHALAAAVTEPVFARSLRPPVVPHSDNALNDLLQTRAMRWSRAARRLAPRRR